jgi:hypothetical protein
MNAPTSPISQPQTVSRVHAEHARNDSPATVCNRCPNALWYVTAGQDLNIFCTLMHSVIDVSLLDCDGLTRQE